MIEVPAEVLRTEGGLAWVRVTEVQGGCGRCDEPGGCRSVSLTQALGPGAREFALPNSIGVRPGDRVRVSMEDGAPLRAALASYGLAAVLVLAGAFLGGAIADGVAVDAHVASGVVAGLALALAMNRALGRSRRWRGGLKLELAGTQACRHAGVKQG